ncbi:MAG: hypothetical protein NTY19_37490 [Planctomycetota bacterium]|nr:hypothetical protein [Planctomycetota bacterium]
MRPRFLASLRIHGRIEGSWNYVTSKTVPMTAGKLYRLSAWVRVDRFGPGTPMPYHPKWTGQHNTLLVNGRGQLGEGSEWFRGSEALAQKSMPKVLRAVTASPAKRGSSGTIPNASD